MTGDDLRRVADSWAALDAEACRELERCVAAELDQVTVSDAADRAAWLVDAVSDLVGRLAVPTQLGQRARALAATWPGQPDHPRFACEGRAWLQAIASVAPHWTEETDAAWRHAWHLLAEVLDEDGLSPFAPPSGEEA
ncbi:MAG TPA: hypothetical protein VF015_07445 [Acidimicrobiales bacterium]